MKTAKDLLIIIEDIVPDAKPSEKIFLASLCMDSWNEGFEDAKKQALDSFSDDVQLGAMAEDEKYAKQLQRANDILGEMK